MKLHKFRRQCITAIIIGLGIFTTALRVLAAEGMWQPHQLPQLEEELKSLGLELDPEKLASLDAFPATAIVSLGGCSASFVSPKGLVVTNHHCVYGSVQYNSTAENNLFERGFLAKKLEQEVSAAPGTRVYVTESVEEVTDKVLSGTTAEQNGLARFETIQNNSKTLIKSCEASGIHRCAVPAYHHGMQFFLIKRLEIRDVRLVYAPETSIGKYGGDVDNWQWPRHTGDFGFYRAYVGKDGKPADFSENNVPYTSENFLKVSAKNLSEGDFVMALGYPGRTNRYRTMNEIVTQFTWYYPTSREIRESIIEIINANAPEGSDAAIAYQNTVAGLANYAKNFQSMEESFKKTDFQTRRKAFEEEFLTWLRDGGVGKRGHLDAVKALDNIIEKKNANKQRDLIFAYMGYSSLMTAASELYRLAVEQEKPDAEREPGYQERDLQQLEQYLKRISKRYNARVDSAILAYLLQEYAKLPKDQRVESIDKVFKIKGDESLEKISKSLNRMYRKSKLDEESIRLGWMKKSKNEFEKSKDPFIRYAVESFDDRLSIEKETKNIEGDEQKYRSGYMQALIAYNESLGKPIYADANSTLRITFGSVRGNTPKDGLRNAAFTSLEGIVEKDSGIAPFNAPKKQLELIMAKDYGKYVDPELGSVPVNFLSTVDITGGNSGSATLNAKGELVGLLFDGVYESIIGDWDFNDEKNRAISVDSRYMLWVMEKLDDADNLLKEMMIVR